ncbi:hypothetical protein DFP73DRAFT_247368 [Morchella snyderi]|nr:hypothetical protein DFP73DRAFT_247368 [Morchella snyderi]
MRGPAANARSLLAVLLATGILVPFLTALRLFIIIRKARIGKFSAAYFGEVFMVAVALLNTVETVLWFWNSWEELDGDVDAIGVWYRQRAFWASITYTVHLWALKGAFLSLYYDLIPTLNWKSRWLLYVTTGLTVLSLPGVLTGQALFCRPINRNWSIESDFCTHITSRTWIVASSWTNIATDLLISAIPLCIISTLKLSTRERYGFIAIYGLCSLSIFASILRFSVLTHDATVSPPPNLKTLHAVIFWSTIEVLCAHICFCIPAFRVLVRKKKERRPSNAASERCIESRATVRTTPVTGGGGEWFDYDIVSPLEESPITPLTGGSGESGMRGDRRSWIPRRWSIRGPPEVRTVPAGLERQPTTLDASNSRGRGWTLVATDERVSADLA